jgi:hypothetical protein
MTITGKKNKSSKISWERLALDASMQNIANDLTHPLYRYPAST